MQINEILSRLYSILECKMALSEGGELHFYPKSENMDLDEKAAELSGYRKVDIDAGGVTEAFYIEECSNISDTALKLAVLFINSELHKDGDLNQSINRLLSGSNIYSDIAAISTIIEKSERLYLIVVHGVNFSENKAELVEIIKSSFEVKLLAEYQDNFVAAVEEQEIEEACSNLQKNVITELYQECIVAIGGRLQEPQQLAELYNSCLEAIELRRKFNINQKVLDYGGMAIYRLVASMDENLKKSIRESIFTSSFIDMLNNEIELTIEEMFRNNLNLTDTSARLYIHRNTLLYRIDKIYRHTGFDLRKFEDSMIFKLAWLMHKEIKNNR
ncbi:MAG: hypothetical protein K0R84_2766 [Clostridia bacterium]|jgi:carbohydrate diacid regulator|nr:hypothetical protein [Clostridia bacterium]